MAETAAFSAPPEAHQPTPTKKARVVVAGAGKYNGKWLQVEPEDFDAFDFKKRIRVSKLTPNPVRGNAKEGKGKSAYVYATTRPDAESETTKLMFVEKRVTFPHGVDPAKDQEGQPTGKYNVPFRPSDSGLNFANNVDTELWSSIRDNAKLYDLGRVSDDNRDFIYKYPIVRIGKEKEDGTRGPTYIRPEIRLPRDGDEFPDLVTKFYDIRGNEIDWNDLIGVEFEGGILVHVQKLWKAAEIGAKVFARHVMVYRKHAAAAVGCAFAPDADLIAEVEADEDLKRKSSLEANDNGNGGASSSSFAAGPPSLGTSSQAPAAENPSSPGYDA